MAGPQATFQTVMDYTALPLAGVYADALLSVIAGDAAAEELSQELADLVAVLRDVPGAELFLAQPQLSQKQRVERVKTLFAGRVSPTMEAFLAVLARNNRLELLGLVATAFRHKLNIRQNVIEVQLTTAAEVPEAQYQQIRQSLEESLACKVLLQADRDERLLGGMVVRIGDHVYDASIQGQLRLLRETLRERRMSVATHRFA